MELCAVLLWALVAGVYSSAPENVADLGPCMSECPGTGQLTFQKGYSYTYSYSTVTETFLQGTSSDKSLLTLECLVRIEVMGKCHMLLKIQNSHLKANVTSKQGSEKEFDELRNILEMHPLQFSYHDGKIQKICPVLDEKTWALNVKRGILSVLQGNLKTPSAGRSIEEVDVLGKCLTTYEFRGRSVWKKKDLTQCSNRILGSTYLRSVPLPDKTQILDSNLECIQNFKDGVLAEATCTESHLVTLFSRGGNGAKTNTKTLLKLKKTELDAILNKELPGRVYVANLMYEKETSAAKPGGEDAAETVRNLCQSSHMNYETTDLFMSLVFELRLLSFEALSDVWQRSSFKCRDNWQPLLDALPSCGTEACVGLMKEILLSKELEDEKMESYLWLLAFIPEPTSRMIGFLTPLLQDPRAGLSVYLAITSMVHHFCLINGGCHEVLEVKNVMNILQERLGNNCSAQEPEELHQVQGFLKAIGNAGVAGSSLIPALRWCALLKTNPDSTRLAAVDAFRRIPCSANRYILYQLYQDLEETEEIRIAAYYTAMKCPSQELSHLVRQTLRHETSTQVGSFVWSHLSQLLESDDPLKQAIADILPDDILTKDFEGESWKYSTYSDATVHSESVGANMEGSLIFTPSSFIPRSAMANLTIHTLGRAVNIMEFGIRLENAEDLLKSMLGHHSSTLNEILVGKEEDKQYGSEPPMETVTSPTDKKPTSKRYNPGELPEKKVDQQKVKKSKHSCPSGKYNKLNDLQQKFTQGMTDKKELRCGLSMKVFGNELIFLDCEEVRNTVKQYSLSLAGLTVKLLKGQEVQYNRRFTLSVDSVMFPAISGFPVQLAINASASTSIKIRGNMDFKQQNNFFINGYVKPSASLQLSAHMGITGAIGKIGLKWVTGAKTMTSLDGGLHMKRGQDLKVFLNTHEESMEILDYSSQLYLMTDDVLEKIKSPRGQAERKSCMNEEASKLVGWQPCLELSFPDGEYLLPFPLSGPGTASLILKKHDKGLHQYLLEASYNQVSQNDGWLPNESTLHFFLGTPKSEIKRDVGIDLYYNIPLRKFRLKLLHPKKKVQLDGRIDSSRNSRNGHLELILDDREIYYIKGMTDLQTVGGEQRYSALAELKLSKNGSPIILSGNITKQLGKKMAFSASLNNLFKETAFVTVLVDKKSDEKMKQYSLESEAYVPGVFGSYGIGLLQHRGSIWSNAMRVKYGLLGDAKFLRHECDTGQKIKIDTDSEEQYKVDFEHEFHCTQIQTLNHKVHLHHEEYAPHIHSYLEVSYGKHWDELNNKKKLFISQTFKNNSNPSSSSYFMEFTLQVAEKQVNYRTQLLHTHSALESNTNFKVQYNDRMPFVAGLQWKDTSKNELYKWEGAFTMDTPWLYLYSAFKLHQPQRYVYQTIIELSAGKALSVKNLVLDMFYKDTGSEKEGRIHIHTPTASSVNFIGGNAFRSYSEMVSLWNQLIKSEIHLENSEKMKIISFKIKGSKQEFNVTVDYWITDLLKKSNFLIKSVWVGQRNPPLVLQLNGQIEDVKKEVLFYQKRGLIHFRHAFKLPVPQSVLLQETFTVDKRKKHYILETKLVLDQVDECIQTVVLGYESDSPYVCATLKHPFKKSLQTVPSNIEACASTRRYNSGKHEVEAIIKVNRKDIFGLTGKFENKSTRKELLQAVQIDMTHGFQLRFPRSLRFDGEVFSRENRQDGFDHGLRGKVIINANNTLQLHVQCNKSLSQIGFYSHLSHPYQWRIPQNFTIQAFGKKYGGSSTNGSFILHYDGKDMVLVEVDLNHENRKNTRTLGVSVSMQQVLTADLPTAGLKIMSKFQPSRMSLTSKFHFNEKSLLIDLSGLKEQKVGLVLSFVGNLVHNFEGLATVPQQLSIDGALKQKKNINEGYISFAKNRNLYQINMRNRNIFMNGSLHNISISFSQNGSHALPAETKLRANIHLEKLHARGQVCIQVDAKLLCVDLVNAAHQEHRIKGILSHNIMSLQSSGIPAECALELTYNNTNNNKTCGMVLGTGPSRIDVSMGIEKSAVHTKLGMSLKHNIEKLKNHKIPYIVNGVCHYQSANKKLSTAVNISVEGEDLKIGVQKKTAGSTSDIGFVLQNDLSSINNLIPSSIKAICNGEFTSNLFYGHCHGELIRKVIEISAPVKATFNGSLLTTSYKTNIFGLASSGDTFARLNMNTEWGLHNTIEIGFKHALPQLQSLGIAKDSKMRIVAIRQGKNAALLDVTAGKCVFKATCEVRTGNNGSVVSSLNWTSSLLNSCSLLEKLYLPKNLTMSGSLERTHCDFGLSMRVDYEGKDVKMQLKTLCDPYTIHGTVNHSVPSLTTLGLPFANHIELSTLTGSSVGGLVLFHSGNCIINAKADIKSNNKTEWILQAENDCKLLKDLNILSQARINGSAVINGCEAEMLCALTLDGNTSTLQMRTECQPKLKAEFIFRHNLPVLKEISEESKLSITVGKQTNYNVDILLKSGTCSIEVKGDINADNKLQWKMVAENKCKTIQDLGAPIKIEGSGYIVINKKANLDSQMLVVVDESTLQGLLILKATEKKQELDVILTHNVQPAITLGIPTRTMVDVTTERSSELYKRSIHLSWDNKQLSEEVNFLQKDDHITFVYKITHNLETLKKLLLEEKMEIRADIELEENRNMSLATYYGPHFMNTTVRIKSNETSCNLTATIQQNWPWLLRNGISASIQSSMDIQAINGKQEVSVEAATTHNAFMCTMSSLSTAKSHKVLLKSGHNIDSFLKFGYPKVIHVTGILAKEGDKVNGTLDLESDKKKLRIDIKSFVDQSHNIGVAAGVKHSMPSLVAWSIPNSMQVLMQAVSTSADIGGVLMLSCDKGSNISFSANVRSKQQREELIVRATHSVAALRSYIPSSSTFITGVMYSTNEAEGKLYVKMEEKELNFSSKILFTENTCLNILYLKHSLAQLKNLPALIEVRTFTEKKHRKVAFEHKTLWGRKELELATSYTGQFPKLSGGHEITGEFSQSFVPVALRHANVSINIEHSEHNHQDHIAFGWNIKNQVNLSSSLKIGRERLYYKAIFLHPFNFAVKEIALGSMSEWKNTQYHQKTYLAWNKGLPVNVTIILEDTVSNISSVWNACVDILPGQMQHIIKDLHICGNLEKTSNLLQENVNLKWNDKTLVQSLLYKRDSKLEPDSLQLEATFENIFVLGCSKQHILTKIDTNYMDTMNHILKLELCDLPHPIVLSGSHCLGKEEFLQSKTQLRVSPDEKDDAILALALFNHGESEIQNYSMNLELKASAAVQLGFNGKYMSSPAIRQFFMEGKAHDNDKWTISASSEQRCFKLKFGHVPGSSEEKGLQLRACMDSKHLATVDTYVNNNRSQERLGHFVLSTVNQSLSLSYQGCGENVAKVENILGNLASSLKIRLVEMNKKFEVYVIGIQKTMQKYNFLRETAGWPLALSQEIADVLQYGPKAFHQMWKQSSLRQMLRHDLPLYLEKVNNLVQQMQAELQRPLSTLKDAYYDATLKPLDDVWKEKTNTSLHQINAYLPSIVKDEWLMEPIRHILHGIKTSVDLGIHQILKWTENKLSRAVSRIRKPLTGLFHYSSNCSVTLSFPVLPMDYHLTDLANITHYIIEEKLMKPLRELYSVNPVAEYYRFKRRMMESPFEYHAILIGNKHIVTFDGNIVDLSSKCSLLLAKDFLYNTFTIVLNQGTGGQRSLHIEMNQVAIDIFPGLKIEENCQSLDLPTFKNGISIKKHVNKIEVSNQDGITVQCHNHYDVCSITLEGWHHGVSAGLFGTNDNEAGNDLLLPDHTRANSTHDFSLKWQVDSQCSSGRKKVKACTTAPHHKLCKALFQGGQSVLRNCFKVVQPAPFYRMCIEDICDSNEIKPICNLAATYVHLCNRNFVPIEMPSQCV
ncbi:uncharacterized protein LOC130283871 isoform X2 [Hyla sarda]|uniref:uncharacterized protein LOC130283871 isoform X2 n=1 Tax=Hyla sarda TaxID=327740 RepID=UPI0024C2EEDF|nr:uncharacterized protein LOC130283871 isoform X2 [Hyla sarda]